MLLIFSTINFSALIRVLNLKPDDRGSIERGLGDFPIFTAPKTNLTLTFLFSGYQEVFAWDKGDRKMRLNTPLSRAFEIPRN